MSKEPQYVHTYPVSMEELEALTIYLRTTQIPDGTVGHFLSQVENHLMAGHRVVLESPLPPRMGVPEKPGELP